MTDFVQLWVYLSSTPLFGLNATLVVYVLALAFYTRMGQAPWANPVLWSILALGTGLWATGTELNISAMMGLTMVIGIVAELGVFYLAELPPNQRADAKTLIAAGRARLRPILMSALIAILALAPLALGLGEGSAMQKPLAIAIITGLIAGVPLILIFCPALLARLSTPLRERPQ